MSLYYQGTIPVQDTHLGQVKYQGTTSVPYPHELLSVYPELNTFVEFWMNTIWESVDEAKVYLSAYIVYKIREFDYIPGRLRSSGLSSTWCRAALHANILLHESDIEYAKTRGGLWNGRVSLLDILD